MVDRWTWALRGVAALLVGVTAFAWPSAALEDLVRLMGVYAAGVGGVGLVGAARASFEGHPAPRAWLALCVLDLGFGVAVFVWPGASALALLWPVGPAVWALGEGVALLLAARHVRADAASQRLLRVLGGLAIVFCVGVAVPWLPGTTAIVWLVGGYFVVIGVLALLVARVFGASRPSG